MIWIVYPPYGPDGEVVVVSATNEAEAIEKGSKEYAMEYTMADGVIYQPFHKDPEWRAEKMDYPRIFQQV